LYRVFIDEVGNHHLGSSDKDTERYLGLTGVMMELEYERGEAVERLNKIKRETFGTEDIVLHRRELLDCSPPFELLRDVVIRERFDAAILQFLEDLEYKVFTVVIDKREHVARYTTWQFHPYHYCLTVLLERYAQWLERMNEPGDVLVESRGQKENIQLEKSYKYLRSHGTSNVAAGLFQKRLPNELKLKPKKANIVGLQLADLIANPSCKELICGKNNEVMVAAFGKRVCELLKPKYLCHPGTGKIPGWGTKWLP
jgi:hypothetical protein